MVKSPQNPDYLGLQPIFYIWLSVMFCGCDLGHHCYGCDQRKFWQEEVTSANGTIVMTTNHIEVVCD